MSAYDAKVDVAALFAVGRDIEPETLQHIFQRINDEAQAMGAAEAQANALAALHTRRRIAEDFSQMCNVREVITGCIRAVEKLGDDGGTSDLDTARAEITRLSGEVARLEAVIADGGFSAWEVACSRADGLFLEVERLRGALERIATSGCEGDGEHAECGDVCIGHEPCDCLSHRAARALRGEPLATDWGRASCAHLCVDCAGFNKCGRCDGGVDASTKCKGCGCVLFGAFLATTPVPPGAPGTESRLRSLEVFVRAVAATGCDCGNWHGGPGRGGPTGDDDWSPGHMVDCLQALATSLLAVPTSGAGEPQP